MPVLYYFHDPMCSWCYAFNQTLIELESLLPETIVLTKVLGGLAPDSITPMPKSLQTNIQANWHRIEKTVPGIQFNYDFWRDNTPFRSTYPSCRAVLAAHKQSADFADKMIQQIQKAYYQQAENPSLEQTLFNCGKKIGLDFKLFEIDYASPHIEAELQKQIQFTQQMGVSSYPSLCLQVNKAVLPIKIDYNNAKNIIQQILNSSGENDGIYNSR